MCAAVIHTLTPPATLCPPTTHLLTHFTSSPSTPPIPFLNACRAPSLPAHFRPSPSPSLSPSLTLSLPPPCAVSQAAAVFQSHTAVIYLCDASLSAAPLFQGQSRASAPCCPALSLSLSRHKCCLSFRSLLCAGGPFPPSEEAGLLPHPDLHPPHYGCGVVTSLLLD